MNAVPSGPVPGPGPSAAPGGRPFRPGPGLLVLRYGILALAAVIGGVLLSRGDVVLGVLLLLFAGLRLVATVVMQRRRADWRRQAGARRGARRRS